MAVAATEITQCTTIDDPGEYVLANNITNESTDSCITIVSENVTFDGNGYTIDGVDRNGTGIKSQHVGVTVENVTVSGFERGVYNVDLLRESELTGNAIGVRYDSVNPRVEDTVIANNTRDGIFMSSTDATIVDNRIVDNDGAGINGWPVSSAVLRDNLIAHNEFGTDGQDFSIRSINNTVRDNQQAGYLTVGSVNATGDRIEDNGGAGVRVYGVVTLRDTIVTNNTDDGVYADEYIGLIDLTVRDSVITDNGGDGVFVSSTGDIDDGSIHGSVIAGNDGLGVNSERDALRESSDPPSIINATDNYWGSSDGPDSAEDPDAPFADPVTGELANGSGDEVSESPTENGTSNVHFDPFLAEDPTTDDEADGRTAYQIDVAVGEVIEDIGSDENAFYGRQGRLLQAKSVLSDGTITDTVSVPTGEVTRTINGCTVTYDAVSFDGSDGVVTVDVAVEDCKGGVTLTLAAYELPNGTVEFQRDVADQQELVAYETVTVESGEPTTITITVTEGERSTSNEHSEEDEPTDTQTRTDTDPEPNTQPKTPAETTTPTETEPELPSTPTPDGNEDTTIRTETEAENGNRDCNVD